MGLPVTYTMIYAKSVVSMCREVHTPSSLENDKEDADLKGNFLSLAWTSCPSSNNVNCPPTYPLLQNHMHSDHPFQVRKERGCNGLHSFGCVFC